MGVVTPILSTIGYGLIIVGLLFALIDTFERKKQKDWPFFLNLQMGVFFAVCGFVLQIIAIWLV
jgi:hypothetical protein